MEGDYLVIDAEVRMAFCLKRDETTRHETSTMTPTSSQVNKDIPEVRLTALRNARSGHHPQRRLSR